MRIIVFLFVVFSHLEFYAQFIQKGLNDSLFVFGDDSLKAYTYYYNDFFLKEDLCGLDTGVINFHRYDPVSKESDFNFTTGNLGLPFKSLFPNFQTNPFSIGEDRLQQYLFTADNVPYYQLKIPYSNISYTLGPREENFVDFTLGNQLSKGLYLGVDARFVSSKGVFNNQRSNNNNFRTVLMSNSRNEKYKLVFNYLRNHFKFGENGGLVNDFYYEDTTRLDRRLLNVNLPTAQNIITSNQFILNQYFHFGDSSLNIGGLFLDLDYITKNRIYSDDGDVSSYYNYSHFDTLSSFDSIANQSVHAFFGWQKLADSLGLTYKIGLDGSYNQFFTGEYLYVDNYIKPRFYINYASDKLHWFLKGSYQFLQFNNGFSYNDNNFGVETEFSQKINSDFSIHLGGSYSSDAPQFTYLKSYSNHFIWENSLDNVESIKLNAKIDFKGFAVIGNLINLKNYIWFSDSLLPHQTDTLVNIFRVSIAKMFKVKGFGSDVYASYQYTDKSNIYRIPELIARANVYISFPLFNNVLQVFPGIEATYISSYYADGYNPANMIFYIQNDKKVDDQIYLDFFINFKIKRARVFVMYKSFNMFFGKYNYFQIAHYPQQDPALKIGLSWRFYD